MVAPYMYRQDIYRYMIYVISLTDISEPGTWMQDASVAYIAYICQPSCISVAGLRMGRSHSDCLCTGSAGESIPGNHISKRLCPFWSRETSQQIFCLKKESRKQWKCNVWLPVHSDSKYTEIKCQNLWMHSQDFLLGGASAACGSRPSLLSLDFSDCVLQQLSHRPSKSIQIFNGFLHPLRLGPEVTICLQDWLSWNTLGKKCHPKGPVVLERLHRQNH